MNEEGKILLDKDERAYLIFSTDFDGGLEGHLENGLTMSEDKYTAPVISKFVLELSVSLGYDQQKFKKASDEIFKKNIFDRVYRSQN